MDFKPSKKRVRMDSTESSDSDNPLLKYIKLKPLHKSARLKNRRCFFTEDEIIKSSLINAENSFSPIICVKRLAENELMAPDLYIISEDSSSDEEPRSRSKSSKLRVMKPLSRYGKSEISDDSLNDNDTGISDEVESDSTQSFDDSESSEVNEWEPDSKASQAAKVAKSKKINKNVQGKNCSKRFEKLMEQTNQLTKLIKIPSNKSQKKPTGKNGKANMVHQFAKSPDYIKGEMRDYQVRGLNWMINLYENGLNGILADEMGLGKTLQTISLLGYLRHHKNIKGKHLIFAPKSTLENWINEFKRWCPDIKVCGFFGDQEQRAKIIKNQIRHGKFDVLVSNYEMCLNEIEIFQNQNWKFIVVDEGHRMKNEKNMFSTYIRTLESTDRLLLTGTPLQNNLHELWALLNFLLPNIFKNSDDFDIWFDTDKCLMDGSLVKRLHKIIAPFLLRRLKSEVEFSLLPKVEYKLYCGITKIQRENYIKVLKKELLYLVNGKQTVKKSSVLMQLRLLTNHPYLIPGVEPEPHVTDETLVACCGKLQMLDKLLIMLEKEGSRVLIFTQFVRMLDILEDFLTLRKYKYSRLDGNSSYEDRKEDIAEFNTSQSETFVFIISTRAGGLGINLQTADTVIVYDSDWNPQCDIQAIDRAHRIGQIKQVRVFRLIAENTIDERIVERAEIKLCLDKKIIQEGRLSAKLSLKKNEALNMITQDADEMLKSTESTVTDEDIDQILKRSKIKSDELKQKVEANEVNFDTIFKFDGEIYKSIEHEAHTPIEHKRNPQIKKLYARDSAESDDERHSIKSKEEDSSECYSDPSDISSDQSDDFSEQSIDEEDHITVAIKLKIKSDKRLLAQEKKKIAKINAIESGLGWNNVQKDAYFEQLKLLGADSRKLFEMAKHIPDKTLNELKVYHAHFWKYNLIANCEKAKEVILHVITAQHTKSLNYIMSQNEIIITTPEFSEEADRFLIRRIHELYQEPVPKIDKRWWLFKKVLGEMQLNEKFSDFVKNKDHIALCKCFEKIIRMVERNMKNVAASDPYTAIITNSQLHSKTAYQKKYVKPTLNDFQFFPSKLHYFVEMEYAWTLIAFNRKITNDEKDCHPLPLTERNQDEMVWLLQFGFGKWSKSDFKQFLQGLEVSDPTDYKNLQTFIPSKTETEIKEYSCVFWIRYHELKDESVKNLVAQHAQMLIGITNESPTIDFKLDCLDNRLMYQNSIRVALMGLQEMSSINIPYSDDLPFEGFNPIVDKFILWKISEKFYCSDKGFFENLQEQAKNVTGFEMTLEDIRARSKQLFTAFHLNLYESKDEISLDYHFQPNIQKLEELQVKFQNLDEATLNDGSSIAKKRRGTAKQRVREQFILGQHLWTRKELLRFFEGFQKFGRNAINEISNLIESKSPKEVKDYSNIFWCRFRELKDPSLKKIAEEALDFDMVKMLRNFLLNEGSEAVQGVYKEDNDDCKLLLVLKEFDINEDVKDVMTEILEKSKAFIIGKTKEDVRNKCRDLMKTYELVLEFTDSVPQPTILKKIAVKAPSKKDEKVKEKLAKNNEKNAYKTKLAMEKALSKENKHLQKEKEKARKLALKNQSKLSKSKSKNEKSLKNITLKTLNKKRGHVFWIADKAELKELKLEITKLSNEFLKDFKMTKVALKNIKWPKTMA